MTPRLYDCDLSHRDTVVIRDSTIEEKEQSINEYSAQMGRLTVELKVTVNFPSFLPTFYFHFHHIV